MSDRREQALNRIAELSREASTGIREDWLLDNVRANSEHYFNRIVDIVNFTLRGDMLTESQIQAKPQIFKELDPEKAVRAALVDLGYPTATYVPLDTYINYFTTLITIFEKRAQTNSVSS